MNLECKAKSVKFCGLILLLFQSTTDTPSTFYDTGWLHVYGCPMLPSLNSY